MDPIDPANRSVELGALRRRLGEVLGRDRSRLRQRLDQLIAAKTAIDDARLTALAAAIDASAGKRAARAAAVPAIKLDETLPIAREAEAIVKAIREHQVVVVAGETGSGKTTQLPLLALAAGRGVDGLIGCTQPRRIAARSVARRVAEELGTQVGQGVGFQVRFTEQVAETSLIKFMTDGIMLAETQRDRFLNQYDTLILDEAHERSLNIDFLLGYLKQLLAKRRDLKLIVTSATIDTARFSEHFDGAPVIDVEGRTYPVEVRYRPLAEDRDERGVNQAIIAAVEEIGRSEALADVLVFLPGEREIRDAHLALSRRNFRETEILPLYARLSAKEQDRVFHPGPKRRIVLTTNVAETSLTVPRIRAVIDTGSARVGRYSPRHKVQRLHIEPISQASADQRKGRCGRLGPGLCIRLYDEADFTARPRYTDPEILRASLANVVLRMLSLGLGDIAQFPFLERPDERAINEGVSQLVELGAIGEARHQLTALGREMARIPIDAKLARMLIAAQQHGAARELMIIASFLSIQDPRERPADAKQAADLAHAQFADPKSDFVAVLKLWEAHAAAHEELTQSKLRDWCEKHFLSFLRMREWRELHRQLLVLGDELGWSLNREAASFEALHRALLAGLPANLARKDEKGQYQGTRGKRYAIFPGSFVAKAPPLWLLSATLLDTQKLYAIMNARIEPEWAVQEAAHLIKRAHHDPHWNRGRGQVMAYEQITLFGLTLVERRPVHFGTIDPAQARAIFIRDALVPCELDAKAVVIAHNRRVLAQAAAEEAKQRRHGLLRAPEDLARWWEGRLPEGIATSKAFDDWVKRLDPELRRGLEWSLSDVLEAGASTAERFPESFIVGNQRLKLHYAFDPQLDEDGVTLDLPLSLLNAVSETRAQWLVPGLLEAKVAELIRALPKSVRRNFVPAPDFARAFVQAEPPGERGLLQALATWLGKIAGIEVAVTLLQEADAALPAFLRMRFRLLDAAKKTLAVGRDLLALRREFGALAREAFAEQTSRDIAREDVRSLPSQAIPEIVKTDTGLSAFPALVDRGHRVDLVVFERADEAAAAHRAGIERLLRVALVEKCKQARKQLPLAPKLALAYTPIASPDQLRDDIVEGALADLLQADPRSARSDDSFRLSFNAIEKRLFTDSIERLKAVEAVLAAHAELLPKLKPPLMGFATANFEDLREQHRRLVFAGFAKAFPLTRLRELPRYLKAMRLRAERLQNDPRKDQARMLIVRDFEAQLDRLAAKLPRERCEELRFLLEELRVQLFAQELGTREPVSEKRVQKLLEQAASQP
ncbi:MAG: ATP-dependent RNA helicase HrpA [Xanthomonadales bacterium]|nr:ATP-dependent RNA helicase HrpA [Xanthomonadales bacterium]